jgi:integrase/recombinase XerD
VHVGLWAATQLDTGAAESSVRRHLSALASFYRYCAAHDLIGRVPTEDVARPVVDRITSPRRAWTGTRPAPWSPPPPTPAPRRCAPRRWCGCSCCTMRCASMRPATADMADLGEDCGHRVLRVVRKSARKAKIPLTPATVAALDAYLAGRAQRAGAGEWRQLSRPLLATAAGGRLWWLT